MPTLEENIPFEGITYDLAPLIRMVDSTAGILDLIDGLFRHDSTYNRNFRSSV